MTTRFRFDRFVLDPADRQLRRDDAPVELNARYLDALALMVREQGRLISKDRFLAEVWRGVPVTDEALTQCIKTLRRQLGDDASRPAFIETVPKHGYRFIAPVETVGADTAQAAPSPDGVYRAVLNLGGAGTLGGGLAGLLGGLFYGLAGASQPLGPGVGALSVLLVVVCLSIVVAVIGAAGVSFGIAAAQFAPTHRWQWSIAGGALGGLVVGSFVKLLGLDTFNLLVGEGPGDITGGAEGAVLGAAVGLAAWLASRPGAGQSVRRGVASAALAGGAAGLAIQLAGGRLMGGSLALLASHFPDSRLRLDQVGSLLGEPGFGPVTQAVTGTLEGALFSAGIVGAMMYAGLGPRRRHDPSGDHP
ncbi:MAG: transcriptional regulator [Pseudomonadota bacterium]|nr:transcriptional regulator [Pseudomonadota bacterium]